MRDREKHDGNEDTLIEHCVSPMENGQRLDRTLSALIDEVSRGRVTQWIKEGHVHLTSAKGEYIKGQKSNKGVKPSYKLQTGQVIRCTPPPVPIIDLCPQDVPFEVVYADDDLAVIYKPPGIIVHPGAGQPDHTLVNGLLKRFSTLSPVGLPLRPGIVHRIDRDTSGLLLVALSERAHHPLAAQFANHSIERTYYALAWNPPDDDSGSFRTGHGRHPNHRIKFTSKGRHKKRAITHWEIIERFDQCALFKLQLETGRTHQIRVHMSEAGMPLFSDALYGIKRRIEHHHPLKLLGWELGFTRQALHAQSLGFIHPITQEKHQYTSPLPADFNRALSTLRSVYS